MRARDRQRMENRVLKLVADAYPCDIDIEGQFQHTATAEQIYEAATSDENRTGDTLFNFVIKEASELAQGQPDEQSALREVHDGMQRAIDQLERVRAAVGKRIDTLEGR